MSGIQSFDEYALSKPHTPLHECVCNEVIGEYVTFRHHSHRYRQDKTDTHLRVKARIVCNGANTFANSIINGYTNSANCFGKRKCKFKVHEIADVDYATIFQYGCKIIKNKGIKLEINVNAG